MAQDSHLEHIPEDGFYIPQHEGHVPAGRKESVKVAGPRLIGIDPLIKLEISVCVYFWTFIRISVEVYFTFNQGLIIHR